MAEIHAVLSPSSADRWMTCPGSVVLTEGMTDVSSDYAAEGSAAHEIAALCLTSGTDAAAYLGRLVEVVNPDKTRQVPVTEDMAENIQVYVDHVRNRLADWAALGYTTTLEVEQRVPIGHLTLEEGAEGTADTIIVAAKDDQVIAEVIDLKMGKGVEVDVTDNRQLRLYALGAIEKFSMLWAFTGVRVAISQPRVRRAPSEWDISIDDLRAFGQEVKNAAHNVRAARICFDGNTGGFEDKYLRPSTKACQWCKVQGTCSKAQAHVATVVLDDFEDLTREGVEQAVTDVPRRSSDNLALAMECVDYIETWCKKVRAETERRLLAGGEVPGFKLVEGRAGARKWSDDAEAEALLKSMRLKQEQMYDMTLISPTSAEKLAKAEAIGPRQWPKVEALITRSAPKPSVAPVSDKRPALVVKPAFEEFDNLEEAGGLA